MYRNNSQQYDVIRTYWRAHSQHLLGHLIPHHPPPELRMAH